MQILLDAASELPSLLADTDRLSNQRFTNRYSRRAVLRLYLQHADQIRQNLEEFQHQFPREGALRRSEWSSIAGWEQYYAPHSVDDAHHWLHLSFLKQKLGQVCAKIRKLLVQSLGDSEAGARALHVGMAKDHDVILEWIRESLLTIEGSLDWRMGISTVYLSAMMLSVSWEHLETLACTSEAAARTLALLHDWRAAAARRVAALGFPIADGARRER